MGSFKQFLVENEEFLEQINAILDEMDEEEIDEFGEYLYNEFFEDEPVDEAKMGNAGVGYYNVDKQHNVSDGPFKTAKAALKTKSDKETTEYGVTYNNGEFVKMKEGSRLEESEDDSEEEPFTLEDVKVMIEALGEDMLDNVLEMLEEDDSEEDDLDESSKSDKIKKEIAAEEKLIKARGVNDSNRLRMLKAELSKESMNEDEFEDDLDEGKNHAGETTYSNYANWKSACKRIDPYVKFDGDKEICSAPGCGEWDGEVGTIYSFAKKNESLDEDWVKLSSVKAGKVQKIKTKKSGKNYFFVISFDEKDKAFEVVTPKAYNSGDTSKTLTIDFDNVTLVSTDDLDEAVNRRMLVKNRNRKKRKFMKNTKADMRKTKTKRKRLARISRPKRKRAYRANKMKIKSYQKSRAQMIKSGKHKVKIRRKA